MRKVLRVDLAVPAPQFLAATYRQIRGQTADADFLLVACCMQEESATLALLKTSAQARVELFIPGCQGVDVTPRLENS